jgi:twitching motility protein PilI
MAKRISLREFQEDLVTRLTSAARGETSRSLLGVKSGNDYWLVDLYDSGEVVPLPALTTVPLTKHWFSGVTNIRGTLYSVVDFSAFQGGEATPRNNDARLLLIGAKHGSNSALLVTRTLGLKAIDTLQSNPASTVGTDIAADHRPWIGERFGDAQGQSWTLLNVRQLLTDPDFLDIGS